MNDVLICALATAEWMAANSSFDKHCSLCGKRVMIAPSGQRLLKEQPAVEILCVACSLRANPGQAKLARLLPEVVEEVRTAQPNWWRKRN